MRYCRVFLNVGLAVSALATAGFAGEDDIAMIRAICEACMHNRSSIVQFDMKARMLEGESDDAKKTLATGEFRVDKTVHLRWCVDGPESCFKIETDLRKDEEELLGNAHVRNGLLGNARVRNGETLVPRPIASRSVLSERGVATMSYNDEMRVANLFGELVPAPGVVGTPLDWGVMGENEKSHPAILALSHLNGDDSITATYTGSADDDGDTLQGVDVVRGDIRWSVLFSAKHSFSLKQIRIMLNESHVVREIVVKDFLDCGENRWVPKTTLIVADPEKSSGPFSCQSYVIDEIVVDAGRPDSCLQVRIAKNTKVFFPEKPGRAFTSSEPQDVDLTKVKDWTRQIREAREKLTTVDSADAPSKVEDAGFFRRNLLNLNLFSVAVLIVLLTVMRLRSK